MQGQPAYPPNLKALRPERPVAEGVATRTSGWKAAIATVVACAVLTAAVSVGMRRPGLEVLGGLGSGSALLDYSRLFGRVAPLSPEFVSKALGPAPPIPSSTTAGPVQRSDGRRSPPAEREVVEHALTNDNFERAYAVHSVPFTARTDTSSATRQASEPSACAPVSERTIWYRYRPDRDLGVIASTIGTGQTTSLAVFTGDQLSTLTEVEGACHRSVRGGAYVSFTARKGATYHLQVTSVAVGGPLVFNLDPLGSTEAVSLGDSSAGWASISANGRFVVFVSGSSNLVPDDENDVEDVFVRDLFTGAIERVSVSSGGLEGNAESKPYLAAISADGRLVAFTSYADKLVANDTNKANDVFVHDRLTNQTTRVSVSTFGEEGRSPLEGAGNPARTAGTVAAGATDDYIGRVDRVSISADGRFVVFESELTGLVPEDPPGADRETDDAGYDVFVHDRRTRRTMLASASSWGENGNGFSLAPAVSADGRYVAFLSLATNLVADDDLTSTGPSHAASIPHVYVRDLRSGSIERVSISGSSEKGNNSSFDPSISADGRYVAFASHASNLVPDDANPGIDVFVHDRAHATTELVSLSTAGEQQQAGETYERAYLNPPRPAISWDGRYVAFHSDAPNLAPGDADDSGNVPPRTPLCDAQNEDVFVRDRRAGTTTMISVSSSGEKGNGASIYPTMSADGRRVVFWSLADNLVADDRPANPPFSCFEAMDVFVHTFPVLR